MEEKKFCKFCGEQIDKESIVCPKCGRQLKIIENQSNFDVISNQPESQKDTNEVKFYEKEWFMWVALVFCAPLGIFFMFKYNKRLPQKAKIIISVVFGILFLIILFNSMSSSDSTNKQDSNSNNNAENAENNNDNKKDNNYELGETFEYSDLEITIGPDYSFDTVDNEFSEYHNQTAVKMPITIKNIGDESNSLNMFSYNIYGPQGTEVKKLSSYFDDDIDFAGELRPEASYTKYLYFLYEDNGIYEIDFDNFWQDNIIVKLDIEK